MNMQRIHKFRHPRLTNFGLSPCNEMLTENNVTAEFMLSSGRNRSYSSRHVVPLQCCCSLYDIIMIILITLHQNNPG